VTGLGFGHDLTDGLEIAGVDLAPKRTIPIPQILTQHRHSSLRLVSDLLASIKQVIRKGLCQLNEIFLSDSLFVLHAHQTIDAGFFDGDALALLELTDLVQNLA